jgi:eukaryotic translation initiation factor 2C
MSRPTIYHVLFDENQFKADQLQTLSYNLCFLAERATRSISMPSPVYRAHHAAFYGRMFLDRDDNDTASVLSSSTSTTVQLRKVR